MKAAVIKTNTAYKLGNDKTLGVKRYDIGNDYPQRVQEIVGASGVGGVCVRTYARFIYGGGFYNTELAKTIANRKGEKMDAVLRACASDFAMFGGFAVHLNYNANNRVTSIHAVPLEHIRFEIDREGNATGRFALYDDWTHRDKSRKKVKRQVLDIVEPYNPRPEIIAEQVAAAGGWANYNGQIYYYTNGAAGEYPTPIYDAELTNMRSEEGLDNVVGRNVNASFLPGAIIVDINNSPEAEKQFDDLKQDISDFQGDENAGNIMLLQVASKEELPQKIDLTRANYDKEFTVSQAYVPQAIGRVFAQPPILRAETVPTGFTTDAMLDAYRFYSTQTATERQALAEAFGAILALWGAPGSIITEDTAIEAPRFEVGNSVADRAGREQAGDIVAIATNETISTQQRVKILTHVYGLDNNIAVELVSSNN